MDELSIFVVGDIDWQRFVTAIAGALDSAGRDMSNEDDRRHQWIFDDFEVTAIANPGYEDDCEIPFTDYSHQIMFIDANATCQQYRIRQYADLVKTIAQSLGEVIPNDLVIIKNLQSFVSFF